MSRFAFSRHRPSRRSLAALCLVALCSATSGEARADASPADKITAKTLFDAARALTKENKYEEACPKLAESQRLDPSMGTEFYLAECYEHLGKIATAWIYYEEVANLAQAAGQTQRQTFTRGRADALKARVPKLAIEVPVALQGATGLVIKRDQAEVVRSQWGLSLPIDPAKYVISAEAKGKKRWSVTIEVKEGRAETVKIPALEDEGATVAKPAAPIAQPPAVPPVPPAPPKAQPPAPSPLPPIAQPPTPLPVPPPPDPSPPKRTLVPSYVLFGLGGASAVAGIVFGAIGVAANSRYNKDPKRPVEDADAIDRDALVADVFFASAILCGAGGLVWLLDHRASAPNAPTTGAISGRRAFVSPKVGPTGGALSAGFTF